jgi:hypothetical protein
MLQGNNIDSYNSNFGISQSNINQMNQTGCEESGYIGDRCYFKNNNTYSHQLNDHKNQFSYHPGQ